MKKILIGVDGSVREREVVDVGVRLAGPLDAQIFLVRAVGLPTQRLPFGFLSQSPDEVERCLLELAAADVESVMLRVPEKLRGGTRVLCGSPLAVIEGAAKELDVDLIIIGSHGHGAIDRILGSTAAKIVNHSECSVLVVRASTRLLPCSA